MTHFTTQRGTSPVLLHVPHSSTTIPTASQPDFVLQGETLSQEANWMADLFTADLFPLHDKRFWVVRSDISRLVVDMERFEDDAVEEMSAYGMGAVYTKTSTGTALKNITAARRDWYLQTYFRPYHAALNQLAKECIAEYGQVTIIDCHSFPSQPRYYEDQTPNRPDMCLGTVDGYTPDPLAKRFQSSFETHGYSVKFNTPFAGSMVPGELFGNPTVTGKVHTIMLEINRRLYMEEDTFTKRPEFEQVKQNIAAAIESLRD